MTVEVIDPVADYAALMETLFDFDAIRALFASRLPHALRRHARGHRPLCQGDPRRRARRAEPAPCVNGTPLPDFGGHHPDPNLVHAKDLYDLMMAPDAPDFGAASDGDGDRNLIIGKGIFVTPVRLAWRMLAANAHLAPGYAQGPRGHRPLDADQRAPPTASPTSSASACYETPTGWKFFGNLLDAGLATICGEESAGTGSNHVREKDGLWAVLLWLNILAARGESVDDIVARALGDLRPQLLYAPRLRGGRHRRAPTR